MRRTGAKVFIVICKTYLPGGDIKLFRGNKRSFLSKHTRYCVLDFRKQC